MEEMGRKDIRRLLKRFGVEADEALVAHLARNPDVEMLRVRITLDDLTDYGDEPPDERLHLQVEGEITPGRD
jgi:5,10-methenyltetrahydromethanopterin hydrogenase